MLTCPPSVYFIETILESKFPPIVIFILLKSVLSTDTFTLDSPSVSTANDINPLYTVETNIFITNINIIRRGINIFFLFILQSSPLY